MSYTLLGICLLTGGWVRADAPAEYDVVSTLRALAKPLESPADLDPLMDRIGDARFVLLGESTHGTSEYYRWRAEISRLLIEEKGFKFIAVEGDWTTCYQLNRYVKHMDGAASSAREIMLGFDRWPQWMWANEETLELVEWLRAYNAQRPRAERVGFYGIDVYGENHALQSLLAKLERLDPELAERIGETYACLEAYGMDFGLYARAVAGGAPSCEQAVRQVVDLLRERATDLMEHGGDAYFNLKQKALVIKNAEKHFRAMGVSGPDSWNFRVDHFARTVDRLAEFYGTGSRGVVWAHNTHIGDARATTMSLGGQRNIGHIARERYGRDQVVLVGFGTHRGSVKAGRFWGGPRERMPIPPGRADSYEALMNQMGLPAFTLIFDRDELRQALAEPRGHRAIGVVYSPERDHGNYVPTILPQRYDAFVFIDETTALSPLH